MKIEGRRDLKPAESKNATDDSMSTTDVIEKTKDEARTRQIKRQ